MCYFYCAIYGPYFFFMITYKNALEFAAYRSKSVNIYIEYNKMLYKYDRIRSIFYAYIWAKIALYEHIIKFPGISIDIYRPI